MMFGVTQATFFILPMLGKHPNEYPRFRDCFTADEEHPEFDDHILVYTRVGGDNRDDYKEKIEDLRNLPGYVTDYDDSFDSTFATFVFKIPEKWKNDYKIMKDGSLFDVSDKYKEEIIRVFPKAEDKLREILYPETIEETQQEENNE